MPTRKQRTDQDASQRKRLRKVITQHISEMGQRAFGDSMARLKAIPDSEWKATVEQDELAVQKAKGPGRGWWGPQKGGTHGKGSQGTDSGSEWNEDVTSLVPPENLETIRPGLDGGLYGAKTTDGRDATKLMIHPGSGQTLVGAEMHGVLFRDVGTGAKHTYDSYVKIEVFETFSGGPRLRLFLDRIQGGTHSERFDQAYSAAVILRRLGFPLNSEVQFTYWMGPKGSSLPLRDVQ